jgi:prophage regulatory protein
MNPLSNVIRFPALRQKLGMVGRTTIFRWERDGKFPKRIKLGANSVGWLESEIESWLESRADIREEAKHEG